MPAIASAVSLPDSWGAVGQAVSEFHAEFVGFEHDVAHLLEDLEGLRRQLDTRTRELEAEKRRLADRESAFDQQRTDANRAAMQLEHQEAELASARQELAEARAELQRARDQGAVGGATADDSQVAELQAELEQAVLELELVRGHAAELQETVSEQKQELAEQRSSMTEELKELRRLLERRADFSCEQPHDVAVTMAPPAPPAAPVAPAPASKDAAAADPVVSSVMAQFAKLQQDVAQRRKNRK